MTNHQGVQDQVALVTGGSRGIGRAIALALAQAGAHVAINYAGRAEDAARVASEIQALGRQSFAMKADVRIKSEVDSFVQTALDRFGKIDILVANAGITQDNLLIRMSEQQWDDVMDTNLKGVFHLMQAVAKPMMKQRSGRIITISSVVAALGNPGQANYVAAKAGLIGLTKTVARELAGRGITANAVAPGFIETEMTAGLTAEVRDRLKQSIPLASFGSVDDVAHAVVFLASPQARYMTGQTIHVDGGMSMNH